MPLPAEPSCWSQIFKVRTSKLLKRDFILLVVELLRILSTCLKNGWYQVLVILCFFSLDNCWFYSNCYVLLTVGIVCFTCLVYLNTFGDKYGIDQTFHLLETILSRCELPRICGEGSVTIKKKLSLMCSCWSKKISEEALFPGNLSANSFMLQRWLAGRFVNCFVSSKIVLLI